MNHLRTDETRTWMGIPYDWRRPTIQRIKARLWHPGGPLFTPKVFGWGYTLNFAHGGAWALSAGMIGLGFLLSALAG